MGLEHETSDKMILSSKTMYSSWVGLSFTLSLLTLLTLYANAVRTREEPRTTRERRVCSLWSFVSPVVCLFQSIEHFITSCTLLHSCVYPLLPLLTAMCVYAYFILLHVLPQEDSNMKGVRSSHVRRGKKSLVLCETCLRLLLERRRNLL